MSITINAATPGFACRWCGDSTRPGVTLSVIDANDADTDICVLCLTRWVDAVTGWRMTSNVLQALVVGDAGERFHHPERFVRPPKRQKREDVLNRRANRTRAPLRTVYLGGEIYSQESDR